MRPLAVLGLLLFALTGCGSSSPSPQARGPGVYKLGGPYQVNGRWYRPYFDPSYRADGVASWYGDYFHGRSTANGEVFDKERMTAAHTTLPLPSLVRVTNLENGRQAVLRVNDRGPFIGDRLIDVSQRAARELGFEDQGLARVRVEFLGLADGRGTPPRPEEPVLRTAVATAARKTAAEAGVAAAAGPACVGDGGAFIQVAAFTEPQRAEALARDLGRRHPTRVIPHRVQGISYSRVQLGPIDDAERARRMLDDLKNMGFQSAFLSTSRADPTRNYC